MKRQMTARRVYCGRWTGLVLGSVMLAFAAPAAEENRWLGKSDAWSDGANWSAGAPPAAQAGQRVVIGPAAAGAVPALAADAAVGGSLVLLEGARLSLNGHTLDVGEALARAAAGGAPGALSAAETCVEVQKGAALEADGAALRLHAGGLLNRGAVSGRFRLTLAGRAAGFLIATERPLELTAWELGPSPYPYEVRLNGAVAVRGDLVLRGGHLIAARAAAGAKAADLALDGDLRFEGGAAPAVLTAESDITVRGTVRSDGSARCLAAPGADPVWDEQEFMGFQPSRESDAWVRLSGPGDRVIGVGGVLPPLMIDKPSGAVALSGDLHCMGLFIQPKSTLAVAEGQTLRFGHTLREFASFRPQGGGDPQPGFFRSSRDLIALGEIRGPAAIPLVFEVNVKGIPYRLGCRYRPLRSTAAGGLEGRLNAAAPWSTPNALAVNRYNSRIQVRPGGALLLDGKPYDPKAPPPPSADPQLDALLGIGGASGEKATVEALALDRPEQAFAPPPATPRNVAPAVDRILTPSRESTVFAVQGPLWANRDVYGTVDGDPWVGAGGASFYEFVFPEAVTVGAFRVFSKSSIKEAYRYVLYGDTAVRGAADTVVASGLYGAPPDEKGWTAYGEAWTMFAPATLSRLRLLFLKRDGTPLGAHVGEVEIYADAPSAERLAARGDAAAREPFPEAVARLERGAPVTPQWPPASPSNHVSRVASIAFWMAGISWSEEAEPETHNALPHLREHAGVTALLDGVKALHYDAVTFFFEGEPVGFPWPSVHFRSSLNARYLAKRKAALMIREAASAKKTGDDVLDLLQAPAEAEAGGLKVKEPEGDYAEVLKIEDLPCQRNLLREFSEAAHARGVKVFVLSRPEDMRHYIGAKGPNPYQVFLEECAAAGVDGVSIVPDEEHPLWSTSDSDLWRAFDERTRAARKTFTPVEERKWQVERARVAGEGLAARMAAVRKVKPDILFYVDGARLLNGGDPYDLIWRIARADYVGCSYQSHLVPRWAAASGAAVAMGSYPHRSVRYNLESVLLGARMVRTYRYNYIELAGSADQRRRENRFIEQLIACGATRPAQAPTALLLSRASEAWWPQEARAGRLPGADPDRAWIVPEIVYEYLLKNGYPFDVFYLDQPGDLAHLAAYPLVIVPFAYAVPQAAAAQVAAARDAGSRILIIERRGETDAFGEPFASPVFDPLIARGKEDASVVFNDTDWAERANSRTFARELGALIDPLLGARKELDLGRYGNRVEAVLKAPTPRERYLSLMNWEDAPARITVGLRLPEGRYTVHALSSDTPEAFTAATVNGETSPSAETLRRFAVELAADEALTLYLSPTPNP